MNDSNAATAAMDDDELDPTIIIAIVIGSTGFVLMMLGAVYYLTRTGDIPSRKAVACTHQQPQQQQPSTKDELKGYVIHCVCRI